GGGLEVGDLARHRQPLGQHEGAGDVPTGRCAGKYVVNRARELARLVDDWRGLAARSRRAGHARRLCPVSAAVDGQAGTAWKADEKLRESNLVEDLPRVTARC